MLRDTRGIDREKYPLARGHVAWDILNESRGLSVGFFPLAACATDAKYASAIFDVSIITSFIYTSFLKIF